MITIVGQFTEYRVGRVSSPGQIECLYDGTPLKHWPNLAPNEALIDLSAFFTKSLTTVPTVIATLGGATLCPLSNLHVNLAYKGITDAELKDKITSAITSTIQVIDPALPTDLKIPSAIYFITFDTSKPGRLLFSCY